MKLSLIVPCAVLAALLPTLTAFDAAAQTMPAAPSLTLAPGFTVQSSVELAKPEAPRTLLRHRSPALMITGITLTCLSGVAAVVGGSFLGGAFSAASGDNGGPVAEAYLGLGALAGGALLAGVGVPLWIYGAKGVPATEAAWVPRMKLGNKSVALAWSF